MSARDPGVCALAVGDGQCLAVSLLILFKSLAKTFPLNWLRTLTNPECGDGKLLGGLGLTYDQFRQRYRKYALGKE